MDARREIPTSSAVAEIRLSETISALSYALDITEGQPEGHAIRSALIGMRLAGLLQLSAAERSALFYALLLKDLGCSSNAAKVCSLFTADDRGIKQGLKTVDWTSLPQSFLYAARQAFPSGSVLERAARVVQLALKGPHAAKPLFEIRCERGASIARLLGFPEATAQAIRSLDEHWDGRGYPRRLVGEEIPLLGRILGLAQTVEVFFASQGLDAAFAMAEARRGKWFDPSLVSAFLSLRAETAFWEGLASQDPRAQLDRYEPPETIAHLDDAALDRVATGFAQVIDAKSPWTFRHSEGVAELAVGVASELGRPEAELRTVRRASLLHDIGKLGISNLILDKPGRLTDEERREMQRHSELTQRILEKVAGFRHIADFASAHHERLDGRGYFRGLKGDEISLGTRILTVADVYEAMTAERPYRPRQPGENALAVLERDAGQGVCPECLEALKAFLDRQGWVPRARGAELLATAASCAAGG